MASIRVNTSYPWSSPKHTGVLVRTLVVAVLGWCLLVLLKKLALAQRASTQEDTNEEVYRNRCAFGKLYGRGGWAERQTAAVRRGGTSAKTLIQYLQGIAGNKRVCIEEGTQAEWLYEVLSPHVAEVVVMNVRGMPATDNKSDEADAFSRADDLRLGRIKSPVYKERGAFGALRAVAKVYDWTGSVFVDGLNGYAAMRSKLMRR